MLQRNINSPFFPPLIIIVSASNTIYVLLLSLELIPLLFHSCREIWESGAVPLLLGDTQNIRCWNEILVFMKSVAKLLLMTVEAVCICGRFWFFLEKPNEG